MQMMFGWFKKNKKPVEAVTELLVPSWMLPDYGEETRHYRILAATPADASKPPGAPSLGDTILVAYRCESIRFECDGPGVFTAIADYEKIGSCVTREALTKEETEMKT